MTHSQIGDLKWIYVVDWNKSKEGAFCAMVFYAAFSQNDIGEYKARFDGYGKTK